MARFSGSVSNQYALNILDSHPTYEDFIAEHPTGNVGDVHLVGSNLYAWHEEDSEWFDAGVIEGPTGPTGPRGSTGPAGPTGTAGADGADGFGSGTQAYINSGQMLLQNSGSQQSLLGLTNGVAVTYATRYKFKIIATIRVAADNVNLFFAIGGETNDQYYRCRYRAIVGKGSYGPGMMPVTIVEVAGTADNQVKNTINIAQGGLGGTYFDVIIEGTVDTRYSGHFKPIILLSPNPGYPNSYVEEGAYMEIYPIGPAGSANADTVIGSWS